MRAVAEHSSQLAGGGAYGAAAKLARVVTNSRAEARWWSVVGISIKLAQMQSNEVAEWEGSLRYNLVIPADLRNFLICFTFLWVRMCCEI